MALAPGVVCPRLVVAVVGIALALGLLPAPPAFALTGRFRAVALLGNLGTRPKCLAAGCALPALHTRPSVHQLHGSMQSNVSRSKCVRHAYPAATLALEFDDVDKTRRKKAGLN